MSIQKIFCKGPGIFWVVVPLALILWGAAIVVATRQAAPARKSMPQSQSQAAISVEVVPSQIFSTPPIAWGAANKDKSPQADPVSRMRMDRDDLQVFITCL